MALTEPALIDHLLGDGISIEKVAIDFWMSLAHEYLAGALTAEDLYVRLEAEDQVLKDDIKNNWLDRLQAGTITIDRCRSVLSLGEFSQAGAYTPSEVKIRLGLPS